MNKTTIFEALFERAADGLLVTDRNGNILLANPAFWSSFGWKPHKGMQIGQFLDGQTSQRLLSCDMAQEFTGIKKDGTKFPIFFSLVRVPDDDDHYYIGQVHDLSREKSNANSLAREQQLGQLKSRLVSMASHEFRSPLSQIQLSASLIERYYQRLDQSKIMAHLQKIRLAVNDMTDTLNDFLSLERIEAGTFQPDLRKFDLVNFGEDLCAQMRLMAGNHQLLYQHNGRERLINSDRSLLKHCVINLLSNAFKYSALPGKIFLRTKINPEGYVITVSDRGIGIPQDEQKKLFEPFFRASNAGAVSGTGLGLHIVKNYVRQLGGEVRVRSHENKGSTFSLSFPALPAQIASSVHPVA
ncbi:PAS domain-containing sensor histidine kinase [Mucilaginibacter sp. AK015]|uniref:PAS domain-containing sensor histidine kinase n=1 Tax=Mucilaginibacter sp. AK015 TaxID=2723072 RepID=UPI00160C1FDD|nr:PAS domain-containing sensor histidine kinase [Mucilaginibacter sp. AK015]MBB5396871.1 PAS domain S-box-containing protein [Mucilaginibacter sp. AK015]